MKLRLVLWATIALPIASSAQPTRPDITLLARDTAAVFQRTDLTGSDTAFTQACGTLLLIAQSVAVALIVAGMIIRIRRDHDPMDGIASMMLKVAFIATVPFWSSLVLETADAAAGAVGYQTAGGASGPSRAVSGMWNLAGQWLPPSSPFLDALDTQDAANIPVSGREDEWLLRGWNWARGVGTATADAYQAQWQSTTGGFRAVFVSLCGAVPAAVLLTTILLNHLAEILRALLFEAGCAVLPLAIAGLGLDAWRGPAFRFLAGLAGVACWPVGWALFNGPTTLLLENACVWMEVRSGAAADRIPGSVSLSAAAPFLAWGSLFWFAALTLVLCAWCVAGTFGIPFAISRVFSAGVGRLRGTAGHAFAGFTDRATPLEFATGGIERPRPPGATADFPDPRPPARSLAADHGPMTAAPAARTVTFSSADIAAPSTSPSAADVFAQPTIAPWLHRPPPSARHG